LLLLVVVHADPSPFSPHLARYVERDSHGPGADRAVATVPGQVAKETKRRFLRRIPCLIRIAQKSEAKPEPWVLKRPQQPGLGVSIAPASSFDRDLIHA
jgi:hypothetical protein